MEVSIIKIGNSKGFRLSKSILERYNITEKIPPSGSPAYKIIL